MLFCSLYDTFTSVYDLEVDYEVKIMMYFHAFISLISIGHLAKLEPSIQQILRSSSRERVDQKLGEDCD